MKANVGVGDLDSFVPNLGTIWKWGISYTLRSLYNQCQLNGWLGGPQSLPGYAAGKKNFLSLPIRTPDHPNPSLVTVPTTPFLRQAFGTIAKFGAPCVVHVLSSLWRVVYHLLSAVHGCLSNIFDFIIHIWRPSFLGLQCDTKPWR